MSKYQLTFKKYKDKYIVSYANGRFKRLEYKSGGLSENCLKHIGVVIPIQEKNIKTITELYDHRIEFTAIKDTDNGSLFAKMMRVYCHFIEEETTLKAKIDGIEGSSLKKIVAYLNEAASSEEEAFQTWCYLLNKWNLQPDFYQKQILLRQINSNLLTLLNNLKDGTGKTKTESDADAIRGSFKN